MIPINAGGLWDRHGLGIGAVVIENVTGKAYVLRPYGGGL